jgi:hypothetical protein
VVLQISSISTEIHFFMRSICLITGDTEVYAKKKPRHHSHDTK